MNNLYLIYGNDYSLIKREINKITSGIDDVITFDLGVQRINEMLDEASCISFFGSKKVLIGENALFLSSSINTINHDFDYLERYLKENDHDNIIIFTLNENKLDERKKIVKLLKEKANVIHKDVINQKDLPKFVMSEFKNEGYDIDYKTASYFVNYVGQNVDILISEIEKMMVYKDNDKKVTKQDINDISCKAFKDNVFDLTDGIMKKDFNKIYECYKDLMIMSEEPIKIISLLGNQFLLTYQVKLLSDKGKDSKEIADLLKVHPYRVKLALETDYSIYDLKEVLKKLHDLDFNIKSGKIDKFIGLEDFLLHL